MITSFSVTNFKSIKDTLTIEFIPGRSKSNKGHISADGCLRSTAIFGANASGKSNYIKGLKFLKNLITDPYLHSRDPIYNWNSKSDITTFELSFRVGKYDTFDEYTYRISVKSVGERNPNITKQTYTFEVTDEELIVADKYGGGEKRILRNSEGKSDNYYKLLQQMGSLKQKLIRIQMKMDNIHKDMEYTSARIQNKENMIKEVSEIISKNKKSLTDLIALMGKEYKETGEYDIETQTVTRLIQHRDKLEQNIKKYEDRYDSLLDSVDKYNSKMEMEDRKQSQYALGMKEVMDAIEKTRMELNKCIQSASNVRPLLSTKDVSMVRSELDDNEVEKILENAYRWFVSTLVILETDDFYMPMNQLELLENISKILVALDVGIYGLAWEKSDFEKNKNSPYYDYTKVQLIKNQIGENDRRKIDDCERNSICSSSLSSVIIKTGPELNLFTYWKGDETVNRLVSYHTMDRTSPTNITSESDGTRRLIELASLLLPSENEKVFIVDELERRLHPLLTQKFIELFLEDKRMNKQLIFATHEYMLMSRKIFRPDEIWYMMMDGGTSVAIPLDDLIRENPKMFKKRTDKLYLDDRALPGIPYIDDIPVGIDYNIR